MNYGNDNLYRLTGETIASDPNGVNGAVNYIYDPIGNRKQLTSTLAPVSAVKFLFFGPPTVGRPAKRLWLPG